MLSVSTQLVPRHGTGSPMPWDGAFHSLGRCVPYRGTTRLKQWNDF